MKQLDAAHLYWMQETLKLAQLAARMDEVPVGALVVMDGKVLGAGFNQPIATHDPTAHAEMIAIRQAAAHIGNYRLVNASLYTTLEPCMMCAGAMVHARISHLIYGARDDKAGVVDSKAQLLALSFLNHKIKVTNGVLAKECGALLTEFFQAKRDAVKKSQG